MTNRSEINFLTTDITKILSKIPGEILFNPALVHWKKDLYICSYRVFIRGDNDNDISSSSKYNPFTDPNHPWFGGEGSKFYWNSLNGYDNTRFVLLRIRGTHVKLVYSYSLNMPGQDIRLFKLDENRIIATGNIIIQNVKLKTVDCTSDDKCYVIFSRILTIENSREINVSKGIILCPEISEQVEKNWSLWKDNDNIFLSYGVTPRHEVFRLTLHENELTCSSIKKIQGENPFFSNFIRYYNNIVFVSLSTPALKRTNGMYVAFGHVKYKYKQIDKIDPNSNLAKFNNTIVENSSFLHDRYIYLMYIYEFSSEYPYTITRISNMFIPDKKYTLVFANNLTRMSDNYTYILSYGGHDMDCRLLYMNEHEIEDALMTITDPQKLQFLLL